MWKSESIFFIYKVVHCLNDFWNWFLVRFATKGKWTHLKMKNFLRSFLIMQSKSVKVQFSQIENRVTITFLVSITFHFHFGNHWSIMYQISHFFPSLSSYVGQTIYHASNLGSIPRGGHTNRSPNLLKLLGQSSLPSFRGG